MYFEGEPFRTSVATRSLPSIQLAVDAYEMLCVTAQSLGLTPDQALDHAVRAWLALQIQTDPDRARRELLEAIEDDR